MSYRSRPKNLLPTYKKSDNASDIEASRKKSIPSNKTRTAGKIYWRHILLLFGLWILLINYYERSVVKRAIKRCDWSRWEDWPENANSHRVSLFADPQIMDPYSYPGRPQFVNYITRLLVDNYHRRNWKFVHYYLQPDTTLFLGDLFDGGRYWEDDEWIEEYKRFNNIFPKRPSSKTIMTLPGNHDIGFGDTVIEDSLNRFSTYFGEPSSYWDIGNHTFVLLDTISLSDKANSKIAAVPKEFLDDFAQGYHPLPKVLLSHVPLWRNPQQQQCGDLRESKNPFPVQRGDQYQTLIDADLSQEILSKIKPEILFSGDDHDYCRISHAYYSDGVTKTADEITVKSCSMNMGIKRPAIQLLSLYNPEKSSIGTETYKTEICYLPDPFKAIKMYLSAVIFTVFWLCYMHLFPISFNKVVASRMGKTPRSSSSSLPLPIGANCGSNKVIVTKYHIVGPGSFRQLLSNAITLLVLVLGVFACYYATI